MRRYTRWLMAGGFFMGTAALCLCLPLIPVPELGGGTSSGPTALERFLRWLGV
jgi:hypothetical protein